MKKFICVITLLSTLLVGELAFTQDLLNEDYSKDNKQKVIRESKQRDTRKGKHNGSLK